MSHGRSLAALAAAVALGSGVTAALLSGEPAGANATSSALPAGPSSPAATPVESLERVARLQARVAELEAALAQAGRVAPPRVAAADAAATPASPGAKPTADAPGATVGAGPETDELTAAASALGAAGQTDLQWRLLAQAYLALGRHADVVRCFRAARPRSEDEYAPWSELLQGLPPQERLGPLEELAGEASPTDELLGDLADTYRELGREADAAALYLRAVQADPDDEEWRDALSNLSGPAQIGALEGALASGSATPSVQVLLAQAYQREGRTDDAVRLLHGALAQEFRLEWAQELIGLDAADAARVLREAAPAAGPAGWLALGLAYNVTGDAESAADALVRGLAGGTTPEAIGMANAAAGMLVGLGPELAIPRLEAEAHTGRGTAEVWAALAVAYGAADRASDARAAVLRALELDPQNESALRNLLASDPAAGEAYLASSATLSEDDELWGDLGDAYRAAGQTGAARRCYLRARELDPDDSEWTRSLAELGS